MAQHLSGFHSVMSHRRAFDFTTIRVSRVWVHDIHVMLNDPAHPGYYFIEPGPPGFANVKEVKVTDPNVAFAVKMRWG